MKKILYRGEFNYKGQIFELYSYAKSQSNAFLNFINQLVKKCSVGKSTLLLHFDGSRDNYRVVRQENWKNKLEDIREGLPNKVDLIKKERQTTMLGYLEKRNGNIIRRRKTT